MKHFLSALFIMLGSVTLNAQVAYEHISNAPIYQFLDELAALHYVDINSAIKPYSRIQIAQWLDEAALSQDAMRPAMKSRLKLFLEEYAVENNRLPKGHISINRPSESTAMHLIPPELVYRDSLLRISLRPIYGIRYISNENGHFYHSYGGASMNAYAGNNWAAWASVRDNYQTLEPLANPLYLTTEPGGNYKIGVQGRKGAEYSEMRGGITYGWSWGSFGLLKDHLSWGDNLNGSNIFSGRTPSFPMIKLQIKPAPWIEFNYFHGWLISQVVDSSRSYITSNGDFRAVFRQKYIAANMYTFTPLKRLQLSVGNSIIYSDVPVQPAYLIPFFFFKSLDHTLNYNVDNQNSAMFVNISSRQIPHLHLFSTLFIDEFSFSRIGNPRRHNFWSVKAGASLVDWPLKSLSVAGEFTRTSPLTYKHRVPTTTFTSNNFNLGHYLTDNAQEIFLSASWNPWKSLRFNLIYTDAHHGNDYQYVFGATPVDENPILHDITWSSRMLTFRAEMLPVNNFRFFAETTFGNVRAYDIDGKSATFYLNRFGPKYLHGKTTTLSAGFGIGF